jgi:hypothetical protein
MNWPVSLVTVPVPGTFCRDWLGFADYVCLSRYLGTYRCRSAIIIADALPASNLSLHPNCSARLCERFSLSLSFYHSFSALKLVIMAIHSNEEAEPQPIDIQAWTEEATVAIGALTIASPGEAHGTTVSLQIPLDEHPAPRPAPVAMAASNTTPLYKRKEPLRRDSMKRREALLRGKEGSRRRQRWENGMRRPLQLVPRRSLSLP